MVPVTATGVRSRMVASRVLGTTLTHWFGCDRFNISRGNILFQFECQCSAVAAHGPTRTQKTIHRNGAGAEAFTHAEDFVGFGHALPFFLGLAIAEIFVDPRYQRAAEWHTEVGCFGGCEVALVAMTGGRFPEWRSLGSSSRLRTDAFRVPYRQQLAHVLGTAARGGFRSGCHPPTRPALYSAPTPISMQLICSCHLPSSLPPLRGRSWIGRHVDRVENDDRVVFHAQG